MVVRYLATALLSPVLSLPGTQGPKQAKNEVMREPRRNQFMLFVPAARLAHHRHANVLLQRIPRVPFQAPGGYHRVRHSAEQTGERPSDDRDLGFTFLSPLLHNDVHLQVRGVPRVRPGGRGGGASLGSRCGDRDQEIRTTRLRPENVKSTYVRTCCPDLLVPFSTPAPRLAPRPPPGHTRIMPDAVAPPLDLAVRRIVAILETIRMGPRVGQGPIQSRVVLPIRITYVCSEISNGLLRNTISAPGPADINLPN